MKEVPDDYVRMQKCIQCGEDTGAILMSRRLQSIPEEQAYSDFCPKCKKHFKTMRYFICRIDPKHRGFIKLTALKQMLTLSTYKSFTKSMIIGFEKCPVCMGMIEHE
jgi:hypothetical protein